MMKSFYSISGNVESSPVHLVDTIFLATAVMFYINITIGSMGGIPLWAGFMAVYYVIRAKFLTGNHSTNHLAVENRADIRGMIAGYAVMFSGIWAVMKIFMIFAQMAGWGSIQGMSLKEYFDSIYGSTLVERWAFVFAAILMFSFVMSLFPLVVMRKSGWRGIYLAADGFFFWIVCRVVVRICKIWIQKPDRRKLRCVMDALYLCITPHKWQAGLFLAGAFVFLVLVILAVYGISVRCCTPGTTDVDHIAEVFQTLTPEEEENKRREKKKTFLAVCTASVVLVLSGAALFVFVLYNRQGKEVSYHKAGECLTEDHSFGPASYEEHIYIPVCETLDYHESGQPVGFLAYKNENVESRFYQLSIANLLYTKNDDRQPDYLEMYGADMNIYKRADLVEAENAWQSDSVFVLWDEEWLSETAYSKDRTGYSICERGFVDTLEEQFGQVKYNSEDFLDYDAYFTISGYEDPKKAFGDEVNSGDWVGCILVKDNRFYYGSYENRIEGVALQELLNILGGNETSAGQNATQIAE